MLTNLSVPFAQFTAHSGLKISRTRYFQRFSEANILTHFRENLIG